MKINADTARMLEYAQQHWFKLLLLAIALYLFTQKEFSFSINLSDPKESQEQPLNQSSQPQAAQKKHRKFGIPSSVLLGTAYLHSIAGAKDIASTANNHFAIQCSNDWRGNSTKIDGTCYRVYENAWTSFRDNSLFLSSGKYTQLKSLGSTDYKAWAAQLEKMRYSHLDNYADQLVQVIEFYGLDALDKR